MNSVKFTFNISKIIIIKKIIFFFILFIRIIIITQFILYFIGPSPISVSSSFITILFSSIVTFLTKSYFLIKILIHVFLYFYSILIFNKSVIKYNSFPIFFLASIVLNFDISVDEFWGISYFLHIWFWFIIRLDTW